MTTVTRRRFLQAGGAALALAPMRLHAEIALGTARVDTLSDGFLVQPGAFVLGDAPKDQAAVILKKYGLGTEEFRPPCNVTLYRDGKNTVLFDAGSGPDFMPTAGTLHETLATMGIAVEDVTAVVFTHGHPDHLWGTLDDFDEPRFPNARYLMGKVEWDYWTDPGTVNTIVASRQSFAAGAARRLEVIGERMELFRDGEEVLPGIAARMTPGHTPGHMSFELRQGSDSLMVLGDCITNNHLAFERPDWHAGPDQDMALGAKTRVAVLDQIASEKMHVIGFHLPNGGIGRAERQDGAYRFVPDAA